MKYDIQFLSVFNPFYKSLLLTPFFNSVKMFFKKLGNSTPILPIFSRIDNISLITNQNVINRLKIVPNYAVALVHQQICILNNQYILL